MAKGYSFTITVDNTQRFLDGFDDAKERTLEAIGMHIEGEAKIELSKDPRRIDTGNLRNGITHAVDKNESVVYIGSDVEYAAYVHEGTSKMAPNRYLKNAVENNKSQIEDITKRYLQV